MELSSRLYLVSKLPIAGIYYMRLIRLKKDSLADDSSLIESYRHSGDKEIIGILFERYAHLVLGVCMKYLKNEEDSKDAVIQIFEKLMIDLKKYNINKFSGWLHSVAKNYCLMQLRNNASLHNRTEELTDRHFFMESEGRWHQEDSFPEEHYLNNLGPAIQTLSIEQRICIELFYLKEESYQDIADLTGYSLSHVKSYIQNGKRNLKMYLQKTNHEAAK